MLAGRILTIGCSAFRPAASTRRRKAARLNRALTERKKVSSLPQRARKEREERILKALETAETHKLKGADIALEIRCLKRACNEYARISVDVFGNPGEGVAYLKSKNFLEILSRTIQKISQEYEQFKSSQRRQVNDDLGLVHYAWLMGMWQEARLMAEICADEALWNFQPGTRFWNEYRRVVVNYVEGKPYIPNYPTLKGYEKYWPPYLALMNAITERKPIDEHLKEIDKSFKKRNKDSRLTDYGFDGDGEFPVKWDLRKASILRTMEAG